MHDTVTPTAAAPVTCPQARMVIGGGYAWTVTGLTSVLASAPSETDPKHKWAVTGLVPAGAPGNTLFAWASCLDR